MALLKEVKMWKEIKAHRLRAVKTIALYLAFLANGKRAISNSINIKRLTTLGMCCGIIGPTLLDLQIAGNTTLAVMTWVVPSRCGGYAVGALVSKWPTDCIRS